LLDFSGSSGISYFEKDNSFQVDELSVCHLEVFVIDYDSAICSQEPKEKLPMNLMQDSWSAR